MSMTETTNDYLNRLIRESGVKPGSGKQAAMVEIIKLLDENSLNGLLASIKTDYERAMYTIELSKELPATIEKYKKEEEKAREHREAAIIERDKVQSEVFKLNREIRELRETIAELEEKRGKLEMLPEDLSRLLAYEAAIEIGKRAFDGKRIGNDEMKQIIRSASNVASNWVRVNPEEKKERG